VSLFAKQAENQESEIEHTDRQMGNIERQITFTNN